MVKHIVFWRFLEFADGNTKEKNYELLKEKLLAMKDKVDGIYKLEVGFSFDKSEDAAEAALYMELKDKKTLHEYQIHPDHVDIKNWLGLVKSEKRVVDFEVED